MKTAISVPDEVFERAERLAGRLEKSRSQLYSEAMAEFLARHEEDEVTEAMNAVVDEIGAEVDPFVRAASSRTLARSEWS